MYCTAKWSLLHIQMIGPMGVIKKHVSEELVVNVNELQ